VVDLPEGATLEATERVLIDAAGIVSRHARGSRDPDAYAGTAAPFNFNGLVRHYYLRNKPEMGDLQVTLRPRTSAAGRATRSRWTCASGSRRLSCRRAHPSRWWKFRQGRRCSPPCWPKSTAPTETRRKPSRPKSEAIFKRALYRRYRRQLRPAAPALRLTPTDADGFFGVSEGDVMTASPHAERRAGASAIPIAAKAAIPSASLSRCRSRRAPGRRASLAAMPVAQAPDGRLIEMGELVQARDEMGSYPIFRRDGRAAEMVMAELAGAYEAPIYGMLAM
jgi:hypothetical protein